MGRPSLCRTPFKATSMLSPRLLRFAFLPLMLLALSVLAGLAVLVFQQALAAGAAEAWMMALVLAVVVGLPALVLLLPVAGSWQSRRVRPGTIPLMGEKIPGTGQ